MSLFSFKEAETVFNYLIVKKVYNKIFNRHINSFGPTSFSLDDYPTLKAIRHTFKNSKHKKLVGYVYYDENVKQDAVLVFSHGFGGGGHHTYLDLISYFARQGFFVFAYDATANDESEGDSITCFVQGYFDADKALSYVESLKEYKHLPLYASGHSWGAYSMSNAIGLHEKVKGYIGFSGFNESTSIFKANGQIYAPDNTEQFIPFLEKYEKHILGKQIKTSAVESFKKSQAKIAIVHSEDDYVVPKSAGIDLYEKEFKDDPRFLFVRLKDKGHGTVYYTKEGKQYFDNVNKLINDFVRLNHPSLEEKTKKANEIINREIYKNLLDEQMLDYVVNFIKH